MQTPLPPDADPLPMDADLPVGRPPALLVNKMTHKCKNITLPKLHLRAIKMYILHYIVGAGGDSFVFCYIVRERGQTCDEEHQVTFFITFLITTPPPPNNVNVWGPEHKFSIIPASAAHFSVSGILEMPCTPLKPHAPKTWMSGGYHSRWRSVSQ